MHGAVLPVSHCGVCCTDLWLSAVVSSEAPGQAVCPEHAAALSAAPDSCTLLFRHSVEELQRLLFEAAALFPGCADDIRAAQQRVRTRPVIRGLKSLGPVLPLSQELPAPRAPELKPGGREPATPTAGERSQRSRCCCWCLQHCCMCNAVACRKSILQWYLVRMRVCRQPHCSSQSTNSQSFIRSFSMVQPLPRYGMKTLCRAECLGLSQCRACC